MFSTAEWERHQPRRPTADDATVEQVADLTADHQRITRMFNTTNPDDIFIRSSLRIRIGEIEQLIQHLSTESRTTWPPDESSSPSAPS